MFSGIVEQCTEITDVFAGDQNLKVLVSRPALFDDLNIGDSIAIDGVCLTIEEYNQTKMQFTLAHETLAITGWNASYLTGKKVNLERSLKLGDRMHGHMLTGHVDCVAEVTEARSQGDNFFLSVNFPIEFKKFIWVKGSITINGVSLTINKVEHNRLQVCLIPETLNRTNLKFLKINDQVNLEMDNWARGLVHFLAMAPLEKNV